EECKKLSTEQVRTKLQEGGLPDSIRRRLKGKSMNLLAVRAPLTGQIVARAVVAGEVVDITKVLFTVVDPSRLSLSLHVRAADARHLKNGQDVRFRPDGEKSDHVTRIEWISPSADEKTRTIRVRATLDNAKGRLRASTFGTGRIILRHEPEAILVPS